MAFSAIGIFSVNNSAFEIHLTALFGVLGFIWMRLGFPLAPMLLGFVLGPLMEEYLRRAMLMSGGDPTVLVQRQISLGFMVATVLILILMVAPKVDEPWRRLRYYRRALFAFWVLFTALMVYLQVWGPVSYAVIALTPLGALLVGKLERDGRLAAQPAA